jgi:rhamnose utilization protein RhaD (predicted bifunctional aldolase and dehydrogenase)/NAD(P)-dependent dehydrogenase (short-subunit alcohol dehydrogenase family)
MKNLWDDTTAAKLKGDLLKLRVYTSRLLGAEPDLVLHGGGNTSVKINERNLFGDTEELLYVKGSGWDLATIKEEGFAPVRMSVLLKMARLDELSDADMVKHQRAAMTDPNAPAPSVEAILHAIIPFRFVDHTHADAVVTITNTPGGKRRIEEIYGNTVLIVPYVMPGFILSKEIYKRTQGLDWKKIKGIILLNHGIFTFHDEANESYEQMIRLVNKAEQYLKNKKATVALSKKRRPPDLIKFARLRKAVSSVMGNACIAVLEDSLSAVGFSDLENVSPITARGPITPDHIIRTKRTAMVTGDEPEKSVERFAKDYEKYFNTHTNGNLMQLDPAPRWTVWPGHGVVTFGKSLEEAKIVADISEHTIKAIQRAEKIGGWQSLSQKDLFEIEYWELEQAKLKKSVSTKTFQGKIALVTGAASGIGKACALALAKEGAVVAALDINAVIEKMDIKGVFGITCDVTNETTLKNAVEKTIKQFGGLDLLISNAGIFSPGATIENIDEKTWEQSLSLNLTSHHQLLKACIPYLEYGIDPSIVIIGSKNVPAPGPGAASYSVAKAGLTQLARVAALELGKKGIRVNVIHPNAVFDTGIWTDEVLEARAAQYGLSVKEYKTNNVLQTEITSGDVAAAALQFLGPAFSKTTGAQIPVDGGNDRVI